MLGRDTANQCLPANCNDKLQERYNRDLFSDFKIAIDLLKAFDDQLKTLHPDITWKIKQII